MTTFHSSYEEKFVPDGSITELPDGTEPDDVLTALAFAIVRDVETNEVHVGLQIGVRRWALTIPFARAVVAEMGATIIEAEHDAIRRSDA